MRKFEGSIQFFIKPNVTKQDDFFATLNNLQTNLLRRGTLPLYTSTFSVPEITDEGVTVYTSATYCRFQLYLFLLSSKSSPILVISSK